MHAPDAASLGEVTHELNEVHGEHVAEGSNIGVPREGEQVVDNVGSLVVGQLLKEVQDMERTHTVS